MSIAVGNGKVFEYFGELFPEIRMVVIDEMQPVERCRFTRCAKFCQKEVKKAKNYIYGLSFFVSGVSLNILVYFDKHGSGFELKFRSDHISGKKYKKCVNRKDLELWKIELDNSTDLIQYGVDEFKSLLQLYQNTIQLLSLSCSQKLGNIYDFGIQTLKNLTKLEIRCDMNLSQIFSKLKKPLEELVVDGRTTTQNIFEFEEVYQVQHKITLIGIGLNYEQLTRLSAKHIELDIGSLTEMDIFNLIRSWQNSTDWKTKNYYYWTSIGSRFNFQHLLRHLGIAGFDARSIQRFPIKHLKDDKVGELRYHCTHFTLEFEE